MADKNTKAKTLKTYKTAAGAQQYGDDKAWGKLSSKITKDFVDLSTEDFKKKYGVDAYKAFQRTVAGDSAAKAKSYKEKGFGSGLAKQSEEIEKKWTDKSKKKGPTKMARGGMAKYNKGGYANCGASMKPTQKSSTKK